MAVSILSLRATRWSCVNGSSMTAAAVRRRSFLAICRPGCGCGTSSSRSRASDGCAWTRDPATGSEVDRNPFFLPIPVADRLQPLAAAAEFGRQVRVLCRLAAGLSLGQCALRGGGQIAGVGAFFGAHGRAFLVRAPLIYRAPAVSPRIRP